MSNKLLFPWIIVLETIVLLMIIGTAYSSDNEAIESAVGPHLLHVVTISLLLITFINPSEDARSYARIYAWTNVAMDNIALFLMLFRYSQTETLHLGKLDAAHFTLYIVLVLILIVFDIHNVAFSWEDSRESPRDPSEISPEKPLESSPENPPVVPDLMFQEAALWTPAHAPMLNIRNIQIPTIPTIATNFGITQRQHPSLRFV